METIDKNYGYIEWLSAEEMHEAILEWMSDLKFICDEQLFLNDLVKSHTLQLIDDKVFEESKRIINEISRTEQDAVHLLKKVQSHQNLLEIMINDVDELKMERAYMETHWELGFKIRDFMVDYRKLKTMLFDLVSNLMRKNRRLLT